MQGHKYLNTMQGLYFYCLSQSALDLKKFIIYSTERITERAFFTLFDSIYIKDKLFVYVSPLKAL